ncbi:thymidine phosphorylase [Thalassotalea hakodatensis]|uniref:thymidine phosphorylase n=1 Tax=Thalassotalea hakodatensis TaxID=3030492 RepID=UPI002573D799|nr:thymidine phosphorylase [Thalassotalea hakodatensis]
MLPQEIIRLKRDGKSLNNAQINAFATGLVDNTFNDAQVGAMAMAIFQQGMVTEEVIALTDNMMRSGDVLSWPELDGPIVDKHSTGGVGDKVSFMLAAIVASCGVYVPMIAGRGLGHTGGTSDKLESISGVDVQPSVEHFKQFVKQNNMAIITQTDRLAPADKRLYAIRDVTSTVESIPLITASILSKKLAAGLDSLVMDIKVGNGAMMTDLAGAQALAKSIVSVANGAGVRTQAIITDMNQVLGFSAGNALEMIETVDYLTGKSRCPRLHGVTVELACSMLISAGVTQDKGTAEVLVNKALSSGQAAERFDRMISQLGGPTDFIENPWKTMQKAEQVGDIVADKSGYISEMNTRKIGMQVVGMKGGRTANGQKIDHSVGFNAIKPLGAKVCAGDVIARCHANNKQELAIASQGYLDAVSISESTPEQTLIYQHIV